MTDLMVSVAAALTVLGCRFAFIRARERVQARQVLRRLDMEPGSSKQEPERRALLDGFSRRLVETRAGAALARYAEKHHPMRPFSDVIAILLIGLVGGAIAGAILFGSPSLTILSALAGPIVADRIAVKLELKRGVEIGQLLPQALNLQAAALRAGHSTAGSLRILMRELRGPLAEEIRQTMRAVDLGIPLERALEDFAGRGPSEARTWVTAMQVHRQTGGNLSAILESLSERIRERTRVRSEVRALTAQGRLSGLVVSLAPAGFLTLMFAASREEMRSVFASSTGVAILVVGLSLQVAGLLWIRSIMKVKL